MHDINTPVTAQNGLAAIVQGELSSTSPTSALVYYTIELFVQHSRLLVLREKKRLWKILHRDTNPIDFPLLVPTCRLIASNVASKPSR